ncbi:DnaJ domain-containing protein [Sulfurimonas sp.]|jgi:DnaJ-class molecular chaperone|uniref:DnaJ domain-containing protein n=1 Tax=Sulfurimonas sp. TaxID=2022749 RepID=UPI0025F2CF71|nr:DnaJ domain-containing protein [Sulfurimonas sp.]MCK9473923.1 DnaJ domain-containing protein [Sulfurimonas sp.]MDD3506365.1 DnaJ domain-containing protein [Sulfurimonas sp.]
MKYETLEKALEVLDIVTRITQAELKDKYLKLSKIYHPDMPDGDAKKFKEINEAYKLVHKYMQNYRFSLDEEEFYTQNPFSRKSKDWFYNF